jgi:hypothetical protein
MRPHDSIDQKASEFGLRLRVRVGDGDKLGVTAPISTDNLVIRVDGSITKSRNSVITREIPDVA